MPSSPRRPSRRRSLAGPRPPSHRGRLQVSLRQRRNFGGDKYASEDIFELIRITPKTAYFRIHSEFYNGHTYDFWGVAYLLADALTHHGPANAAGDPCHVKFMANADRITAYCENFELHSADKLVAHRTDTGMVIVIEQEVKGTILATRTMYGNWFCSIIAVAGRKVVHWRDYMDSLADLNALAARDEPS